MKLLVDAHIGKLIVGFLERDGHDVLRAHSFPPRTSDEMILRRAAREERVVMTADKDFGELVFRNLIPCEGLILLRVAVATERARLAVVERFWPMLESNVRGRFLVVTETRVRRRPLPLPL